MPISGLVITLVPPSPDAVLAEAWLREDERFSVGEMEAQNRTGGQRLPVTLDTRDRDEDKELWQQMQEHPGIAFVDVTCVFFEDDDPPPMSEPIEESQPTDTSPLTQGVGRGNH